MRKSNERSGNAYCNEGVPNPFCRSATTRPSQPTTLEPFRFTALPPELRNNIYQLVVVQDEPVRLRCFRPPAITRVCRRLRAEALPVFFDVNTFAAEVIAPVRWDYYAMATAQYLRKDDVRYQSIGTLRISADSIKLFKVTEKVTARIRNLDFVMVDIDAQRKHMSVEFLPAVVCMRSQGQGQNAAVSVHIRKGHFGDYEEDVRYLTHPVKKFLNDKMANPNFKGLTITELQRLANTVRVARKQGRPLLPLRLSKKKQQELATA
jgi:hypothetical protein